MFNVHYVQVDNELAQLKEAILLAKSLDEDVFLFTKDAGKLPQYSFDEISNLIIDLVTNNITMLFLDVESAYTVRFNKYLEYIEDITTVNSFFITKPLYPLVLALIDYKEDYHCDSLLKLIQLVDPYNYKLSNSNNFHIIQQKINVVSPFRNAAAYLPEYLDSIHKQHYSNYKINLIDDNSEIPYDISDRMNNKVNLIVNKERKYALQNILDTLVCSNYNDDDIICFVDADDVLLHNHVFEILNAIYSTNSNINLTYGSMIYLDRNSLHKVGSKYSKDEFASLRLSPWKAAHLRTFKYKLFKKLLSNDPELHCLRDDDGEIFKMPYDMAFLFPLMELAGYDGIAFLNTPLYGYRMHENNDHILYRKIQYESEMKIRNKKTLITINY